MKTLLCLFPLTSLGLRLPAAGTNTPANRVACGANLGWINWRGGVANGAVIGASACSGSIWSANAGRISLGNGSPGAGASTTRNVPGSAEPLRYFILEAVKPLQP